MDDEKFEEQFNSTITERRNVRRALLELLKNDEINKEWPAKSLAQEIWALSKDLRHEYGAWDTFWPIRAKTFRKIRSGEIEGYDYGIIYNGLELFLLKNYPNHYDNTADDSSVSPRSYNNGTLSKEHFSEGLRESLNNFNAELNYLTIEQVRALECAQHHQNLWVQGAAGTGKTIFAVEAAYRALRAGLSVLMVYRTRQFHTVFTHLLDNVNQRLNLLLHLDFMYLVRLIEQFGINSDEFLHTASELLPNTETGKGFMFDLIIVDDCGTYETQFPHLITHIEEIAYRKIFLAAPEQILDNILIEFASNEENSIRNDEVLNVVAQPLTPPDHYFSVFLHKNIRNSRDIIQYTNKALGIEHRAGINEAGRVNTVRTNWDALDKKLLSICTETLQLFPPERIKILVDPSIRHPAFETLTPGEYEEEYETLLEQCPELTKAILIASREGHFLHSTFECEDSDLQELATKHATEKAYFIYTDGEVIGSLTDKSLEDFDQIHEFFMQQGQWSSPHIDAKKILDHNALSDPLQITSAIVIYPVPLFIGLEADVVIYIRSQHDQLEKPLSHNGELLEKLKNARNAHHFLAMSRAKHHLINILVE